jgi:uncharacterized protein YjlB
LPRRDPPSGFETLFTRNGWTGSWRNGLYTFDHYHSTAHEVLGVSGGIVRIQLGGERGPIIDLGAGDVVVIPAGVAHKNVGASADFRVVGAYPIGTAPDLLFGKPGERPAADDNIRNVARLALPADPVEGAAGALAELWKPGR